MVFSKINFKEELTRVNESWKMQKEEMTGEINSLTKEKKEIEKGQMSSDNQIVDNVIATQEECHLDNVADA
ncbi:hypothetical protein VIGAN_04033000, partial [Vigna angularis var. angularis]